MSKLIILILAVSFALPAFADDDEMKTDTKGANGAPVEKNPFAEPPKGAAPPSKLDPHMRAKIRTKAPFWIEDTSHGAAIRINKDGTISSENQGGGSIAGSWKVLKGGHLEITNAGETYKYSVSAGGGKVQINGKSATKGRYKLN